MEQRASATSQCVCATACKCNQAVAQFDQSITYFRDVRTRQQRQAFLKMSGKKYLKHQIVMVGCGHAEARGQVSTRNIRGTNSVRGKETRTRDGRGWREVCGILYHLEAAGTESF